jgi:hypothetical protein
MIMKASGKRNPIYLFYEQVMVNEKGEVGEEGDKHYKCYHGRRKTFTISKVMNYSLNGMFLQRNIYNSHLTISLRVNRSFEEYVPAYVPAISGSLFPLS